MKYEQYKREIKQDSKRILEMQEKIWAFHNAINECESNGEIDREKSLDLQERNLSLIMALESIEYEFENLLDLLK